MSYNEKLLDFICKLYTKLGEDPSMEEACQGQNIVIELHFKDLPNVKWQVGAKDGKWFVNKGTPEETTAIIEYLKLKYANDWWSGRLSADALFQQGGIAMVKGTLDDLMFMSPVEEPLQAAYQELKSEFPGLPPVK